MQQFQILASYPEVIGAVVSNSTGTLLQSAGDIDAESVAAVLSYVQQTIASAGESLGLGDLTKVVATGAKRNCVIVNVRPDGVVGAFLDAGQPLSVFEKKLEALLQR